MRLGPIPARNITGAVGKGRSPSGHGDKSNKVVPELGAVDHLK